MFRLLVLAQIAVEESRETLIDDGFCAEGGFGCWFGYGVVGIGLVVLGIVVMRTRRKSEEAYWERRRREEEQRLSDPDMARPEEEEE